MLALPENSAGRHVPRVRNQQWQDDAVAYLTSGSAAVLARQTGNDFSPATVERLHAHGTVVEVGGVQVLLPEGPELPSGARP